MSLQRLISSPHPGLLLRDVQSLLLFRVVRNDTTGATNWLSSKWQHIFMPFAFSLYISSWLEILWAKQKQEEEHFNNQAILSGWDAKSNCAAVKFYEGFTLVIHVLYNVKRRCLVISWWPRLYRKRTWITQNFHFMDPQMLQNATGYFGFYFVTSGESWSIPTAYHVQFNWWNASCAFNCFVNNLLGLESPSIPPS